ENFVSKLDLEQDRPDGLGWMGKLDAGTLKLKVAASIVAISSIHLLRKFMEAERIDNDKLLWYVIIHLTFVISALLMGVLDRITRGARARSPMPPPYTALASSARSTATSATGWLTGR